MTQITDTKQLGQRIRQARKQQGLTQQQLAASCAVGVRFLRELEQGKASCQIGKALTVVSLLGLRLTLSDQTASPIYGVTHHRHTGET